MSLVKTQPSFVFPLCGRIRTGLNPHSRAGGYLTVYAISTTLYLSKKDGCKLTKWQKVKNEQRKNPCHRSGSRASMVWITHGLKPASGLFSGAKGIQVMFMA